MRAQAITAGSLALRLIGRGAVVLPVMAVFARHIYLDHPQGVIIIVADGTDPGPIGVSIADFASLGALSVGSRIRVEVSDAREWVSELSVTQGNVVQWRAAVIEMLRQDGYPGHASPLLETVLTGAGADAAALSSLSDALQTGGAKQITNAVQRIVGRGAGLTPAGDDFLCGVMLALQWTGTQAHRLCPMILSAAPGQTTRISLAFLAAAAAGHAEADWHRLLTQTPRPTDLRAVLAKGHSSGADTLAGVLWALDQPFTAPDRATARPDG